MTFQELLRKFEAVSRDETGQIIARCPMPDHPDRNPSVIISITDNGSVITHCRSCGANREAMAPHLGVTQYAFYGHNDVDLGTPRVGSVSAPVTADHVARLEDYLGQCGKHLADAAEYIKRRFNLSVEAGELLGLGVDPGGNVIDRPVGFKTIANEGARLIVPFCDPSGRPLGLQGRLLDDAGVKESLRWKNPFGAKFVENGGADWSKFAAFGFDLEETVIITEGPGDALACIGFAKHPAIAIRGSSNAAAKEAAEIIIEWLAGRPAVIIGDNDVAGDKFSQTLSQKTGLPVWNLPEGYGDLCDYLGDGGTLDEAVDLGGSGEVKPDPFVVLQSRIANDVAGAALDEDLLAELAALPRAVLETILENVIADAPPRQTTSYRQRMATLGRAVRDFAPPPGNNGGGGGGGGLNGVPADGQPVVRWDPADQQPVTEAQVRDAMDQYGVHEYFTTAKGVYVTTGLDDNGDDSLVVLDKAGVKSMLGSVGFWEVTRGGNVEGHIPNEAVNMVSSTSWDCELPYIKRKVEVPFMLRDGSIVSEPGYFEEAGVFYLPRDRSIEVPEVPDVVTAQDIAVVNSCLDDILCDFLFKSEASKTNLIAMMLTSPLREILPVNDPLVPMIVATAPQERAGKGTVIRCALATTGAKAHQVSGTVYNANEEEFEKKLMSELLKKVPYIFFDNVRQQVNSAVLENMLVNGMFTGRVLGHTRTPTVSTQVLWAMTMQGTGSMNRDTVGRSVPVEIRYNTTQNWTHRDFWRTLDERRGMLIWCAFVAARKWMQDGCPKNEGISLPSYYGWTDTIGGIVSNTLGRSGFLENHAAFKSGQDASSMTLAGILERWRDAFGEEMHPVADLSLDWDDADLAQMLGLGGKPDASQAKKALSRVFSKVQGHTVEGGYELVFAGKKRAGSVTANVFHLRRIGERCPEDHDCDA